MESGDDQQYIRVLGRGGIEVLDAARLGDWNILFHIGSFFNPTSGLPFQRQLRQQRRNFCTLIEIFGPNQFVLVATPGAPFSPENTELSAPQTLHGCLQLPYVCRFLVINGVPESSGNILRGHHRAGNLFAVQIGPRRPFTQTWRESGGYGTGTSIYSGIPTAGTSSTDDRIANSSQATNTWKIRAQGRTIRIT